MRKSFLDPISVSNVGPMSASYVGPVNASPISLISYLNQQATMLS